MGNYRQSRPSHYHTWIYNPKKEYKKAYTRSYSYYTHFHNTGYSLHPDASWYFFPQTPSQNKSWFSSLEHTNYYACRGWGYWIWLWCFWMHLWLWKKTIENIHLCWYHSEWVSYIRCLLPLRPVTNCHTRIGTRRVKFCRTNFSVDKRGRFLQLAFCFSSECFLGLLLEGLTCWHHMPKYSSSIQHHRFLSKMLHHIYGIQCYQKHRLSSWSDFDLAENVEFKEVRGAENLGWYLQKRGVGAWEAETEVSCRFAWVVAYEEEGSYVWRQAYHAIIMTQRWMVHLDQESLP